MRLVERMTIAPAKCLYCGGGNVPNRENGEVGPFLDLIRDVNWGDSVYFCMDCVSMMAAVCGYVTQEQLTEMQELVESQRKEIHDLEAKYSAREARVQQILSGRKALKAERRSHAKKEAAA